jgi:hypothetical protein
MTCGDGLARESREQVDVVMMDFVSGRLCVLCRKMGRSCSSRWKGNGIWKEQKECWVKCSRIGPCRKIKRKEIRGKRKKKERRWVSAV